jgi:hypothetical protein
MLQQSSEQTSGPEGLIFPGRMAIEAELQNFRSVIGPPILGDGGWADRFGRGALGRPLF